MSARTGSCRHYDYDNGPECKAGLDIRKVHGNVLACLRNPEGKCSLRVEFDAAEVRKGAAEAEASWEMFVKVLGLIGPGDPGDTGEVPCPMCEGGTISFAFTRCNGHLHARCSTTDCFGVIQ